MQYIIMIFIIIGLAVSDIITGWIKAYITDRPRSQKMRIGGLHKLAEITVMLTACGLEIGMEQLGMYYHASELAAIAGSVTSVSVFIYIAVMEIVSIFENYTAINPDAEWVVTILEKLKNKS